MRNGLKIDGENKDLFLKYEQPIHDDGTGWDREYFEIKPEHLKLLKEFRIDWSDVEFGAPEVDPKRPYGNSDVLDDMREILKVEAVEDEDGEFHIPKQSAEKLRKLHRGTQTALEICLRMQKFGTGKFVKHEYHDDWVMIVDEPNK